MEKIGKNIISIGKIIEEICKNLNQNLKNDKTLDKNLENDKFSEKDQNLNEDKFYEKKEKSIEDIEQDFSVYETDRKFDENEISDEIRSKIKLKAMELLNKQINLKKIANRKIKKVKTTSMAQEDLTIEDPRFLISNSIFQQISVLFLTNKQKYQFFKKILFLQKEKRFTNGLKVALKE
ncbi:hypothetical protein MHBO_003654 [Bonamia ostreae]|uniref:Uncharacterized protein n=1 Tax=Bonamia ostreae TaxID=126728 RepID=A0ABV2AR45_9EUKA